ncbi:LuxR C-terminal-related transcriptional regulator [Longispora albida]|uniref:LuxR C-terminal-related transcriptional regulator n=1 Tax=Longispora albida TaxID=203523 RepID=UPI000369EA52|nr:LuxR C-terminal-related transcriptional regulator [Longispora albida]
MRDAPAREVRSSKAETPLAFQRGASYASTKYNLRRGVIYRTILHTSRLSVPTLLDYYRDLQRSGYQVRVSSDYNRTVVLHDRTRAFVQLDPSDGRAGALLIRNPGIVSTLADLFDQAWLHSADLETALAAPPQPADLHLLTVLQGAPKDEVAARQLGVSVRTFRRHVAELMQRLGAENRFQLAALAKERGWL